MRHLDHKQRKMTQFVNELNGGALFIFSGYYSIIAQHFWSTTVIERLNRPIG